MANSSVSQVVAEILNILITIVTTAILIRALLSFIVPIMGAQPHPILVSVQDAMILITEPILAPIRRVLPTVGVFDLSPMVAIIILVVIQRVIVARL